MAKEKSPVLNDVLVSLATEAAQDVEGIRLLNSKRNRGAVSVYVLPNEKVTVDFFVSIDLGYSVPTQVAVKKQIEGATKFKVQSVNVQVVTVNVAQ